MTDTPLRPDDILRTAETLRRQIGGNFHEQLMEDIYAEAARLADRAVTRPDEPPRFDLDRAIDRVVTSRVWGFPLMILLFALVFWITIAGPMSRRGGCRSLLHRHRLPLAHRGGRHLGLPWWLAGLLIDGMYLATAWVVSVMLPPMAIFFPLFTLLEDFGYLPRVAFNLDNALPQTGAHGRQALSMMMGFGCNAAGVVATRIIDSPRERLIAMITNNFALCNGRWPTQILMATLFIGSLVPAYLAGLMSALAVVGMCRAGRVADASRCRGSCRGRCCAARCRRSAWSCRPTGRRASGRRSHLVHRPHGLRAVAGGRLRHARRGGHLADRQRHVGGQSMPPTWSAFRIQFGLLLGLNGVILLAYVVAIPANEIVMPAVLMLTMLLTGMSGAGGGGAGRTGHQRHDAGRVASRRLDAADGRQPDALQPAPQPVFDNALHDLQRVGQPQVGHRGCTAAAGDRGGGDVCGGAGLAATGVQIYRTLAQLAAEGLVERAAGGEGPRDRHTYAITDDGQAELRRWLATPLPPQDDRNPFLIQVFFAANLGAEEALAVIEQHRTQIRAQAALFAAVYEHALAQRAAAPNPQAYFFSLLTLEYVLSLAPGYLRWLDSAVDRIRHGDYKPASLSQLIEGEMK
jgi:ferrous iron transport protein B